MTPLVSGAVATAAAAIAIAALTVAWSAGTRAHDQRATRDDLRRLRRQLNTLAAELGEVSADTEHRLAELHAAVVAMRRRPARLIAADETLRPGPPRLGVVPTRKT